jgi:hypothetical protein
MRALGSPIEAPVSERGLDYITIRALGSPIEAPFHVFARIVILMREKSVDRDPCLSNVAVLPERQCADGECQCANGDHRLRIVFLKIEIRPL